MQSFLRWRVLVPAAAVVLLACWAVFQYGRPPQPEVAGADAPVPSRRAGHAPPRRLRNPEAAATDVPQSLTEIKAADWEDPERYGKHLATLIRWAAADPVACREWVLALAAGVRERLIPEISGSLMADTPLEAFQFLNEMPPSALVDQMLRQAAMELATRDPAAVIDWAAQQTDPAVRELLLSAAFCAQAQTEPERAAKAALESIHEPASRDRVTVEIVQRWAQQNTAAAAKFAGALKGPVGPDAARVVASEWVAKDASACAAWILTLPSEAAREAFRPYLDHQIRHDRDSLLTLAPGIKDAELAKMLQAALDTPP